MNKTILVTGGSGFIGKRLCEMLTQDGFQLISINSSHGDIAELSTLSALDGQKIYHVFHLAGNTFVPKSWEQPHEFVKTNVLGTSAVLDFCKRNALSLTYVSAYIYGNEVNNPIQEESVCRPNNPYALTKRMGEELCKFYADFMGLKVNIVRPFNVYGPGQDANFLIPFIVRQAKESDSIQVKDLFPKRDYIHLDDLVGGLIKAMDYKEFAVFNMGSGKSYSVKELIDLVLLVAGKNLPVFSDQKIRPNEISDTIADISKARQLLGWAPETDLKKGIETLFR
jgi:GDP-4-dehydro-6-deoxy-D-mannose reductase